MKCVSLTAVAAMTSTALAMLLGSNSSVTRDSDGELDTTLPNVMLDHDDLLMLDVGFSDDDNSEGNVYSSHTFTGLYCI